MASIAALAGIALIVVAAEAKPRSLNHSRRFNCCMIILVLVNGNLRKNPFTKTILLSALWRQR
jgi:hypothetical protein